MPYKRIAARVGISVATAYDWTCDIEITPEQKHRNLYGPRGPQNPESIARRAAARSERWRERRRGFQLDGQARARHQDPLHMAGCLLYWAEGSKARNVLKFCNSDVNMVRFFTGFLQTSMGVKREDLSICLNVYLNNGLSLKEIEDHWLEALGLTRCCLRKHSLNHFPTSSSGTKRTLPYGVCTLTVARSTWLVQHIFGAIQEYGSFEEPKWLDGPPRKPREHKPAT